MQTAASVGMAVSYILFRSMCNCNINGSSFLVRLALHLSTPIKSIVSLGRRIRQVKDMTSTVAHAPYDVTGFSRDVCAILLIANITRCFYWLGDRFELALLIQSLLMIMAQVRTSSWYFPPLY